MATFRYKAVSRDGANVTGVVEAYDEFEAIDALRRDNSVVTEITEVHEREEAGKDLFAPRKIKEKSLAILCSQFSIIINSGLPIVRALELVAGQTEDRQLKKILFQVSDDVASGHSIAQSFENKAGKMLPTTFIETIRAGEAAGTLDVAFEKLHTYYDKSSKIRSKVVTALAYPAFVIAVAVIVVIIIMTVAVPVFTGMFASLGSELPITTKILIGTSDFMTNYWWLMLGIIVMIALGLRLYKRTEKGRLALSKRALKRPVLGKIQSMRAASQFANTMSTMLSAGLPMVRTVSITGHVLDNYYLGIQTSSMVGGLESGRRLGDCMRQDGSYPELLTEMTAVGEETGSMEHTLDVIGQYYDNEVDMATTRALSLLEPAIVIGLAVFVMFILLAVYEPLFSMYASF